MDKMQEKVLFTISCMLLFQILDKVLNSPDSGSFFLRLNYFYYDASIPKVTTQFFLSIATLHDFHMSNSLCFLSHDLSH